ncbi:MAG: thioredoxin [Firmicutes bacterium]|nr:thioredoxin [Bacillota bacterium]
MSVTFLNADNFDTEVMQCADRVLIDFYADWCGPCHMLSPVIEQVAEERADIHVCKVNVDRAPELAAQFGITSIPALVVMDGGRIIRRSVGFMPKEDVLELLK